jgi:hypothetical protein
MPKAIECFPQIAKIYGKGFSVAMSDREFVARKVGNTRNLGYGSPTTLLNEEEIIPPK